MKRFPWIFAASSLVAAPFLVAADPAPRTAPPSLDDLAWMEGHWVAESESGRAEEIWMAPLDGSMAGSFRWVVPGRMHVLEYLVIEETGEGIFFRFKHYDKDYRAWEAETPNTYELVEVAGRRAVFRNVEWNGRVPQRIVYESPTGGRLVFTGESPDAEGDDEPLVLEFERAE